MSREPYSALGGVFEYLNDDCGYGQWSQYLIEKLKSLNAGEVGVDLGCGNGYFTRTLIKAGYTVTGVDISEEMLSKAVELSLKEGARGQYLLGDAANLKLNFKPDFIVAVNDCFNYVPQSKLNPAFTKIYKSLKPGGAFIFDISAEEKLKNDIGNNLFADDREDVTCLWFNSLKEDRVETDLTIFLRRADGSYIRKDERQTQYIHREEDVLHALKSAGFEAFSEERPGESKLKRINFICRKI